VSKCTTQIQLQRGLFRCAHFNLIAFHYFRSVRFSKKTEKSAQKHTVVRRKWSLSWAKAVLCTFLSYYARGFDRFHLVAHSIGGIIGIELGEIIPNRLRSFINIEGNITAEDCTMSKRVAEMGEKHFTREGFEELKHSISIEAEKTQSKPLARAISALTIIAEMRSW